MNKDDFIPVGLAIFAAVIFSLAIAAPVETIYHWHCGYMAKEHPEKYDKCTRCGYWFRHKDMSPKGMKWYCDRCYYEMD